MNLDLGFLSQPGIYKDNKDNWRLTIRFNQFQSKVFNLSRTTRNERCVYAPTRMWACFLHTDHGYPYGVMTFSRKVGSIRLSESTIGWRVPQACQQYIMVGCHSCRFFYLRLDWGEISFSHGIRVELFQMVSYGFKWSFQVSESRSETTWRSWRFK